jgi:polyphosphate kinase
MPLHLAPPLEHSRIYRFANGAGTGRPLHLKGSADLMTRNVDRRVEALVPVAERALQRELDHVLDVGLADGQLAWSPSPATAAGVACAVQSMVASTPTSCSSRRRWTAARTA